MPVDTAALELVARRAGGSMRDSQSLLDQLLAFGGKQITAEDVHRLLGTASDETSDRDRRRRSSPQPDRVLALLDRARRAGVQLGEFVDQLLDYLRDLMVIAAGAETTRCYSVAATQRPQLAEQTRRWGLADDRGRAPDPGGNQDADAAFGSRPGAGRTGPRPFDPFGRDPRPGGAGGRIAITGRSELEPQNPCPRRTCRGKPALYVHCPAFRLLPRQLPKRLLCSRNRPGSAWKRERNEPSGPKSFRRFRLRISCATMPEELKMQQLLDQII